MLSNYLLSEFEYDVRYAKVVEKCIINNGITKKKKSFSKVNYIIFIDKCLS